MKLPQSINKFINMVKEKVSKNSINLEENDKTEAVEEKDQYKNTRGVKIEKVTQECKTILEKLEFIKQQLENKELSPLKR